MEWPDEIAIGRANHYDLPAILEFANELRVEDPGLCELPESAEVTRKAITELIDSPALGEIWLAKYRDKAIGYLAVAFSFSLEQGGRIAFLDEIFVDRDFRRRGIGRQMLERVEAEMRKIGVKTLLLEVSPGNPSASRLYRAIGFEDRPYGLMQRRLLD